MKLKSITATDILPIKNVSINEMGSIVIIAGANGAGKTRLKQAIIEAFQSPNSPKVSLLIEATRAEESTKWGTETLTVTQGSPSTTLETYMNSRTRGGSYVGTVIQVDSNRSVSSVQFRPLTLTTPDPDDVDVDFKLLLNPFTGRWNDIVNKIYEKVANRVHKIAEYARLHPGELNSESLRFNPDPFIPYQEYFNKLLPGKTLNPIDPRQQAEFTYSIDGGSTSLSFNTLSSGEQEVIKIVFDLLQKRMTHCIFLIDEPELHLHPTLTFRLIETLRTLGDATNQFIFFTHSGDLISTYYSTGDVYFIDTNKTGDNQAHKLSELDEKHANLVQLMSENLGLFAVGKKLIFVEGEHSSRDRLTYSEISRKYFPEAYVIPVGSVDNIQMLHNFEKEINDAIFGIDLFMIRDRDGLTDLQISTLESKSKLRCLKKRHLENYFLDPDILLLTAKELGVTSLSVSIIEAELIRIASEKINHALSQNIKEKIKFSSYFNVPNIKDPTSFTGDSIVESYIVESISKAIEFNAKFDEASLRTSFVEEKMKLENSLADGTWKDIFPGKIIFNLVCSEILKKDSNQVRQQYVMSALVNKPEVFQDIIDIYNSFQ